MNLHLNILVNLLGRLWVALMSFAFVPLYLRFLGVEGYGFIGLFATILAMFSLLDLGLSVTVNREMARLDDLPESRRDARALLRTLEIIYWTIGLLIGLVVVLCATAIARRWVHLGHIPVDQAERAIRLMGVVAVVRWPVSLYMSVLLGRRRQVAANVITCFGATLASAGAVLALWLIGPTVTVFFGWQIAAMTAQIAVLMLAAWRQLPLAGDHPRFSVRLLKASASFSIGVMGISLLSLVLTQLDKLLLTRFLPLREFGFYALASGIASMVLTAGSVVETATFPALTAAVARGDTSEEQAIYHRASQIAAILLFPAALTLALFSPELLLAYLGNAGTVAQTHLLLTLLVIGNACLTVMLLPLSLQLAHGWTSLSIYKNIIAVLLYVPMLIVLIIKFGAVGAASTWIVLTAGYLTLEIPIMHRKLLPKAIWQWYRKDIGYPLVASLIVLVFFRFILPDYLSPVIALLIIAGAAILAFIASCVVTDVGRATFLEIRRYARFRAVYPPTAACSRGQIKIEQ